MAKTMLGRFLLLMLFSMATAQSFAATGKIYDTLSGAPISGATVYAVWYFQFFDLGQRCGGTALAVTEDRGEYTLDPWMSLNLAMHDYALWVVARGYYDPWEVGRSTSDPRVQILPRLDKPPLKSTSRAMAQIGNVPIDAQLLAIQNGTRGANCGGSDITQFRAAVQHTMNLALCANAHQTPSADLFRFYFPGGRVEQTLWRELVDEQITKKSTEPIPDLARDNACALLNPRTDNARATATATETPKLRISLKFADSDVAPGRVPIRILWGVRDANARTLDREHPMSLPRRSIVTATNENGTVDVPITADLVVDQALTGNGRAEIFNFLVVPYVSAAVGFEPYSPSLVSVCTNRQLLEETVLPQGKLRIIGDSCALSGVTAYVSQNNGAKAGHGSAMNKVTIDSHGQVHDLRPTPTEDLSRVNALAALENQRRHQTRIANIPSFSTVYLYHWNWPASALLARTYSLLTLTPDIETDFDALLKLQRSEVVESFNHLCSVGPDTPVQETYEVLRLLWWAETQISDRTVADTNAQARALAWDNGSRCKYQDGKMMALGGTSPPFVLTTAQACGLWKPLSHALTSLSLPPPRPMSDFHIDYSARPQACVEQRNFGSSL